MHQEIVVSWRDCPVMNGKEKNILTDTYDYKALILDLRIQIDSIGECYIEFYM